MTEKRRPLLYQYGKTCINKHFSSGIRYPVTCAAFRDHLNDVPATMRCPLSLLTVVGQSDPKRVRRQALVDCGQVPGTCHPESCCLISCYRPCLSPPDPRFLSIPRPVQRLTLAAGQDNIEAVLTCPRLFTFTLSSFSLHTHTQTLRKHTERAHLLIPHQQRLFQSPLSPHHRHQRRSATLPSSTGRLSTRQQDLPPGSRNRPEE